MKTMMTKLWMLGFIPYSGALLALLYSPALSEMVGPLPAVMLGAFWWPYAFVTVALMFYNYDMPVGRVLGPPIRLQRFLMNRPTHRI